MKSMYTLLADVYELALHTGAAMGNSHFSIESIIEKVRKDFSTTSPEAMLASHVEEEISQVENPSFFGIFKK